MQTLVPRGCGLAVHQATVVACWWVVRVVRDDGKVQKQMRTFATSTRELLNLRAWLEGEGCRQVAMESTGVYGNRFTPFWKELSRWWPMRIRSRKCRDARPMAKTQSGGPTCSATDCCAQAACRRRPVRELRDLTPTGASWWKAGRWNATVCYSY